MVDRYACTYSYICTYMLIHYYHTCTHTYTYSCSYSYVGHEDSMNPSDAMFKEAHWGSKHNPNSKTVIFTSSVARGLDSSTYSSPNDLRLFLGSARRAGFNGDIVIAIEKTMSGIIA